MLAKLQNNAARIKNVNTANAICYHESLVKAKDLKTEAALNRVSILYLSFLIYNNRPQF